MGRKGVFQQDNAPIHMAKLNSKIFKDLKIKVQDWPAQSPDLNPIENIWRKIKFDLSSKNSKNKNDLKKNLIECYNSIDLSFCQKLIDSMPKRCRAVIDNFGYSTKY